MSRQGDAVEDDDLWSDLVAAEGQFTWARSRFMTMATDRVATLRRALANASHRGTALRVLLLVPTGERQAVFPELIDQASVGHADVGLVREVVLSLPSDWVLERIESEADRFLADEGEEEYRRFLELYYLLDPDLTERLATRARASPTEGVREAGEDFLARLRDRPWPHPL